MCLDNEKYAIILNFNHKVILFFHKTDWAIISAVKQIVSILDLFACELYNPTAKNWLKYSKQIFFSIFFCTSFCLKLCTILEIKEQTDLNI